METDQIVDVLVIAGILALIALPVVAVALCLVMRAYGRARGEAATYHRRMMDAEALRRIEASDLQTVQEAAALLRGYEAHHRSKDEPGRPEKAERNRTMAERLERVVGRMTRSPHQGYVIHTDYDPATGRPLPNLVDEALAHRRPAHGGYPG